MHELDYSPQAEPRMQYWAAYKFLFTSPKAWTNLLQAGVCAMIPFVGTIVVTGYAIEAITTAMAFDQGPYPDFNFSRFGDYLVCGVWPFLVGFVLSLVMVMPMAILWFVLMAGMISATASPMMIAAAFVVCLLVYLAVPLAFFLLYESLMIRAALLGDFPGAFNVAWVKDFIARMWPQILLTGLFLYLTAIPLALVGYACCLIGVFPAMVLMIFAQWGLCFQIYRLYLARGGMPVVAPPPMPGTPGIAQAE